METAFLSCAIIGGTLMVCQFLLSMLGWGEHPEIGGGHGLHDLGGHDAHSGGDHGSIEHDGFTSWFLSAISLRTVLAALTFFGLGGLAGVAEWGEKPITLAVALAAGAAAFLLVAWLMQTMYRLQAQGNVRIDRAVGQSATVYLSIPARKAGVGKVLLNVQNRTMEYQAITAEQELLTGAKVVVVAVISPDTVEVAPATESERVSHV